MTGFCARASLQLPNVTGKTGRPSSHASVLVRAGPGGQMPQGSPCVPQKRPIQPFAIVYVASRYPTSLTQSSTRGSSMIRDTRVILQPAGGPEATAHYVKTVRNEVRLATIAHFLSE